MGIKAEDQYELIEFIIKKIDNNELIYNDWKGYKFDIYEGIFYYEIYFFDDIGRNKFDFENINCPFMHFERRSSYDVNMISKIKVSYSNCVLKMINKMEMGNFPNNISFKNSIIV